MPKAQSIKHPEPECAFAIMGLGDCQKPFKSFAVVALGLGGSGFRELFREFGDPYTSGTYRSDWEILCRNTRFRV